MRIFARLTGSAALALLGAVLITTPATAQDDAAQKLPMLEKSLWEAWSKGQTAPFEKHVAENTVNVNAAGVDVGKAALLESMKKNPCKVANYSLGDIRVTRVADGTAVLTYTATQDATCAGRKMPAKVNVSSVWVKQGDQWLAALYHESPAGM